MRKYRNLTKAEIQGLQNSGCTATSWEDIQVAEDFAKYEISNVSFNGKTYLSNNITLKNIASLSCTGKTSFGNGTEVGVLKEDGGLEVIIYDGLTSMEAAFEVQEAQAHPDLVKAMQKKAHDYADNPFLSTGSRQAELRTGSASDGNIIEEGAVVTNCLQLTNIHVGAYASVVGATRLEEVTIQSSAETKSGVGANVILDHVIIGTESHVTDGAQMDYCFVGQGCHIGRMYSATQSLFFANCHFENGEACAYFAGPYSVSHHKATLMIACMTSFFNAGSGSNQSNHSYKMGPNKYGQMLRGAKLGSSSYVYWPMQIGAFSTVIMHHVGHQDLRDLPFSLITEGKDGNTHIIPGQAFRSVGTRRDALKWPKRDKRKPTLTLPKGGDFNSDTRRDKLNFTMLNPYTVDYILKGLEILNDMLANGQTEYKGCIIEKKHIERGIMLYEQAISMYLAPVLRQAEGLGLRAKKSTAGTGEWADYGGMLLPKAELMDLLAEGKNFADIEDSVAQWEYNWVANHFDISDPVHLIHVGESAEKAWNAALDTDGEKDIQACNIVM